VKVNVGGLRKSVQALIRAWGQEQVMDACWKPAQQMLNWAKNAPIPRDVAAGGGLYASGAVERMSSNRLRFGFNRVYAAFQDQGDNAGLLVVLPRHKRSLFIPLSNKARRTHVAGVSPSAEGLVWGEDYVLAANAVIQIKGYGSSLGPNHYFSGTLKRKGKWLREEIARQVGLLAQRAKQSSG
jgi:hypothetical protein